MTDLFRYPIPSVKRIAPDTLPTAGGVVPDLAQAAATITTTTNISTATTESAFLDIYGANFGSWKTTKRMRVYLLRNSGEAVAVIDLEKSPSSVLILEHEHIRIIAPEGEGTQLNLVVEIGGTQGDVQNSTEKIIISYQKPTLSNVSHSVWPTSGCVDGTLEDVTSWSLRLDGVPPAKIQTQPLKYARRCNRWSMVTLYGSNFGRPSNTDLLVHAISTSSTSAATTTSTKFVLYPPRETHENACNRLIQRTHDSITLCTPVGYGDNLILSIVVAGQSVKKFSAAAAAVRFQPPLLRRSNPNPYTGSVESTSITLHGINFGGTESIASVTLGGKQCNATKWNPVSEVDGLPFISCVAPRDVVGPKNLTLWVAGQQMEVR
jgi:hypothetical protein